MIAATRAPRLYAADRRLMVDALDALERAGCQFFACPGPEKRMKPGASCAVCMSTRALRKRLAR